MIDSHCHLDHEPMFSDLENVLLRSKAAGVKKILSICTTNESFEKIKNIVKFDPIIYGTYGIHPHESSINRVSKDDIIINVSKNNKIIAIGESGLDFYYNHSDKNIQMINFKNHIEASIDLNLPIVVHSRNAENETFELLNFYKNKKPKVLMHCFTGSAEFAKKLLKLNCYFSASGIITFKNSLDLQKTFESIPIDKLLIETDSPFLTPEPHRGKKNEPCFIKHTLEKLAKIKKISTNEAELKTTENFNNLFNLN